MNAETTTAVTGPTLDAAAGSAVALSECKITGCERPATCEIYALGEWWTLCDAHAVNKIAPRRPLQRSTSPNAPSSSTTGGQP